MKDGKNILVRVPSSSSRIAGKRSQRENSNKKGVEWTDGPQITLVVQKRRWRRRRERERSHRITRTYTDRIQKLGGTIRKGGERKKANK